MAKLDESVLSHVSIPESENGDGNDAAMRKEELVAGIQARERLLEN
eukprot:CAMPEP_0185585048 /NCGR_PEP_ID=MMETSP0434-20130131/36124_1 /TAXON_ID=626734 ORGANISM="Favella taraikaensis, Strain Fe Narragansett Bay" /NCGR_SAMPLE_ID=MMETSP0434 /ASSEMBLY_ACC=CAM_ASM_000379 /LENGTH=45 /DNA_ID= /DNA_START= /DNA_END= /DNA_ORIENTATION=